MAPSSSNFHDYASDGEDEEVFMVVGQPDNGIQFRPPDITPLLTELSPNQIPLYFTERDGRLFHSQPNSPYPLPADTPEQQRLNVLHSLLDRLIGANYIGPVSDVLAPDDSRHKMALDFCTGTGKWVTEMAREFPHVLFRGLDIVPIATRYPPSNVQFELHDISTQCRWDDGAIDLVHARDVSLAIHDYPAMLEEVARLLRAGGLFFSGEWGQSIAFHPDFRLPPTPVPGAHRFFDILNRALEECRGLHSVAHIIPTLLSNSALFTQITPLRFYMPIGPWHADEGMQRLGRAFRAAHLRYVDSVKPFLEEAGWNHDDLDVIIEEYTHELRTIPGLVSVYHIVHAKRA